MVKYDTLGCKVELNDPDLGVIKYSVDPVGQVWRQVSPRQAPLRQATTFKYDALGRMAARYETDLESHWIFDQQGTAACAATKSCGQLVEAYTQAGTLKDYDRLHTYDDAGRPQKVVQTIGDGASDASYSASTDFDAWGRPIRQTYQRNSEAIKVFDSRYNENGYPAQGANAVRPHAISKLDGDSFTYDDNGNLLSGGGRSYTWTSFDMPITITRGTATSGFVYGPEHQRLRQSRSGGAEVYAGAQEVEKNAAQLTVRTYWPYGVGFEIERGGETKLYWTHVDGSAARWR